LLHIPIEEIEDLSITTYRIRLRQAINASNLYKEYGEFQFLSPEEKKQEWIEDYKQYEQNFHKLNPRK